MPEHRQLAAIMFTDIVGYSTLMSKDEKLAMKVLENNREIHKTAVAKFHGQYIKEIGDGTLSIFQSSVDAVICAMEIQKACCRDFGFQVRVGIHIGDVIFRDNDVFGDGVNIASRIESTGKPGGIYFSEKVYDDIRNKTEINVQFIGEKSLKNIDHPVKVYSIIQEIQGEDSREMASEGSSGTKAMSIAILPFLDMSRDKDQEYFCDGLAEEVINTLTQIEGLKVIARTSAFAFKNTFMDIREIGRMLDVDVLLEGSVQKAGERLRITAQLIHVIDGSHLWSQRFDRNQGDLFAIQDEIALQIAEKLKVKLSVEEQYMLTKRYTEDIETYNLYLKGRFYWSKYTGDNFNKSISYYQEALKRDPDYGPAHAGIALCHTFLGYYMYGDPKQEFDQAEEAAKKALALDENLTEAHLALAWAWMGSSWDLARTEHEFKRAKELNPGYSFAHAYYAAWLSVVGRYDEAVAEADKAEELDPLSPLIITTTGLRYYYKRDYQKSIFKIQQSVEIAPDFVPGYWMLSLPLAASGKVEEAIQAAEKAIETNKKEDPIPISILAMVCALSPSHRNRAFQVIDQLKALSKRKRISLFFMGAIYATLGDKNEAMRYFEKAYEEVEPLLIWLRADPIVYDRMVQDSGYRKLLKKLNLEK